MFRKVKAWVVEKLFGKDRRIAELEKKLTMVEERIKLLEPHALTTQRLEKVETIMNDNTRTIHYLLSSNHMVRLEAESIDMFKPPVLRIVSEE